jgi:hypothetical protein
MKKGSKGKRGFETLKLKRREDMQKKEKRTRTIALGRILKKKNRKKK